MEDHDSPPSRHELDDQGPSSPSAPNLGPSDTLRHPPPSSTVTPSDDPSSPATNGDRHAGPSPGLPKPSVDARGRTVNPRTCVTCRKRKVRCDKTHPCNHCSRAHIECVFPAPGRAPRKSRKVGDGKDKDLLERLRRLEGVVKGLGVEVPSTEDAAEGSNKDADGSTGNQTGNRGGDGDNAVVAQPNSGNSSEPANSVPTPEQAFTDKTRYIDGDKSGRFENRFGRLVVNEGKSRYINNSFWASLSNEVEDLKGMLNQSSDEEDTTTLQSDLLQDTDHQGFVFGYSSHNVDMLSMHPLPHLIELHWEIYKDRVDPLVKVLHIPTIEATVLSAASHLSNLSKGFEALLFAIYYGATTSLSASDCVLNFGEEKSVLLSRYRFAVEQALARANFLVTEEIVVLQTFVIFLICLRRNSDARVIWTLTGLVVRIAQTIGIHRDGSHFGLQLFETEMRRRLWWQICILDTRASEDHGCDPTITEQSFDTKLPLNINDADIYPGIQDLPPERLGCTDMSFCLIRFEVANTFRRINYIPPGPTRVRSDGASPACVSLGDKERWITECHQRLEERYLKHCDMSVPIFWVTATVARLMMSKMWLMVYHPFQRHDGGASLSPETKEKLFITSLENIEYSTLLETESRTMKWGWLFKTYMQWHALAFMLSELCHRTHGDLVERAWLAVERIRDGRWGVHLTDNPQAASHLWRPLKKLYRRAQDARQQGLQDQMSHRRGSSNSLLPTRHYSPNANPMFGHPGRPQMVRAPLSAAQVHRFSDGPAFGEIPTDKHELLKSPTLSLQTSDGVIEDEVDPMDTAGSLQQPSICVLNGQTQSMLGPSYAGGNSSSSTVTNGDYGYLPPGPNGKQFFAPTPQSRQSPAGAQLGKVFLSSLGAPDLNNALDFNGASHTAPPSFPIPQASGTHGLGPAFQTPPQPQYPTTYLPTEPSNTTPILDPAAGLMDTPDEMNWESWDHWAGPISWDLAEAGTEGAGPSLRTGPGMGLRGDWF